jgi:hypothetical protein
MMSPAGRFSRLLRRLGVQPRGVVPEPVQLPVHDEPPAIGHVDIGGDLAQRVGEPGVADQHLRLRVVHDVGDLRRGQVPVDRDQVHARFGCRQQQVEVLDGVGQQHRDLVAPLQAQPAQAVGGAVRTRDHLASGEGGAVGFDEAVRVGRGPRDVPDAEDRVTHGGAFRVSR